MHKRQAIYTAAALALVLGALGPAAARAGFVVTVDTSALNGKSGYVDFQLNPGGSSAESMAASVTNFKSGGTAWASAPYTLNSGDATGSLPGNISLDNGTAFNDAFQGFTFGKTITLDLAFSGQAIDHPGGKFGTSFALGLYAADGYTPLLTTDPNGSVLTVNINPSGPLQVLTFAQSTTDSTPVVDVQTLTPVPAPSALVLLASALPALAVWLRRRAA